jgi:hypothetical protein
MTPNLLNYAFSSTLIIQAALILRDFFLYDFVLTWLEHLLHSSNLCDHFQFNAIWHRRSVAALVSCGRLAGSDGSVTPSVTCRNWLRWRHNHAAHLVSSATALSFLTNSTEEHKSTTSSAIQVTNRRKTISIEEKLHIISRFNGFLTVHHSVELNFNQLNAQFLFIQ